MYLIYLLLLYFSYNSLKNNNKLSRKNIIVTCVVLIYIGTYAYFTDDYEPYVEIVDNAYNNRFASLHIEPLWVSIINFFKGDLELFRASICILIILLLMVCGALIKVNFNVLIPLYILLCYGTHIVWLRQPIVYFIFILGVIFYCKKKPVLFILCLLPFSLIHKSSILFYIILPFIFFPLKNNKYIILSVVLIPLFVIGFNIIFKLLQSYSSFNLEHYLEKDGVYADRHIIYTIISKLRMVIHCYVYIMIVLLYRLNENQYIKMFVRIIFGLLYFTVLFTFLPTMNNTILTRLVALGSLIIVFIISIDGINWQNRRILFWSFINVLLSVFVTFLNNHTHLEKLLRLS
ncbi:MAG: EpsG family protein [Bacteroides sp]|nr:EpsG family protein [Bacteroides sp.]